MRVAFVRSENRNDDDVEEASAEEGKKEKERNILTLGAQTSWLMILRLEDLPWSS